MSSINFRIKGTKNPRTIYARLYFSESINTEVSTGLTVHEEAWNSNLQKVKNKKISSPYFQLTNNALDNLRKYFDSEILNAISESKPITKKQLKDIVPKCFNQIDKPELIEEKYFTPFIREFIKSMNNSVNPHTGKKISKRTIQKYQTTLKRLQNYEEYIHKDRLLHTEIDLNFHNQFINYCRDELQLKNNTIGKYISNIKLFCKEIQNKGYRINQAYNTKEFYIPKNSTKDFALTEDEVKSIENLNIDNSERLKNARDWFVIGIWTGLRVGDLLNLSKHDIEQEANGDVFITLKNQKTGINVVIPLHPSVKQILEKRDGSFPKKLSPQKFNDYIKEIAKLAGLNQKVTGGKTKKVKIKGKYVNRKIEGIYPKHQLISSHCCRRTFATFHYGKIDTLTIMNITGHTTEKQFLEYVKITPKQHAREMMKMWQIYFKIKE